MQSRLNCAPHLMRTNYLQLLLNYDKPTTRDLPHPPRYNNILISEEKHPKWRQLSLIWSLSDPIFWLRLTFGCDTVANEPKRTLLVETLGLLFVSWLGYEVRWKAIQIDPISIVGSGIRCLRSDSGDNVRNYVPHPGVRLNGRINTNCRLLSSNYRRYEHLLAGWI